MGSKEGAKQWWTSGFVLHNYMTCQSLQPGSMNAIWYGNDPLMFPTTLLLVQLVLIFITNRVIYSCFIPLRQSMTVAQIVAGIIIGPSFFTHDRSFSNRLFPPPAKYILRTLSGFGFMLHLFIFGVKLDVRALLKSVEVKSVVIGLSGFFFSAVLGATACIIAKRVVGVDITSNSGVGLMVVCYSMSFLIVTTSYLNDLNISNSQLGSLACSASLVVNAFGYLSTLVSRAMYSNNPEKSSFVLSSWFSVLTIFFYYCVLFLVLRPLIVYIIRQTPEGTPMKRSHFSAVLCIVFLAWFSGECLGQQFCTFLFGLSLPDGPPLGSILVQKLEIFTSGLLLPVFCTVHGLRTNIYLLDGNVPAWVLELVFVICRTGKFIGTVLSSFLFNVPVQDAISLGLLMSCQGIMEIAMLGIWKDEKVVDDQVYGLGMLNIVIFTGVALPLVQHFYDPLRGYMGINRRSVFGSSGNGVGLQILACVHSEENVPTIVSLLEASKGNNLCPVSVLALQLVGLSGRAMPILAPMHELKSSSIKTGWSEHISNAFLNLERQSEGLLHVQRFLSVTQYASMHNDICTLAHDKRTSLIILPFHKVWAIDGSIDSSLSSIRDVNRKVLLKAPCSVAILIDRAPVGGNQCVLKGLNMYEVALLFIGGSDDHEALAIAGRMGAHPNVRLTVLWLKPLDQRGSYSYDRQDSDGRIIKDFQFKSKGNERTIFKEKAVVDSIGTTKAILSVQNSDLVIVGRYHEPDCPATLGLTICSECPELGTLADMLASTSEFRFSVLVVQQLPRADCYNGGLIHSRGINDQNLSTL